MSGGSRHHLNVSPGASRLVDCCGDRKAPQGLTEEEGLGLVSFPYADVFRAIERSLKAEASKQLPIGKVEEALGQFRFEGPQKRKNLEAWQLLVEVIFYSGFRAETVSQRLDAIHSHLGDFSKVSTYGPSDIERILADPRMVRNRAKVAACVANAPVFSGLVASYGSFAAFVDSFTPYESFEGLWLLKEELEAQFRGIGEITTYHVMTDLGLPVLKPDRVIMRVMRRLGLIRSERQLLNAVIHGRRFAEATREPIRYIDIVLVAYGQLQSTWIGLAEGICTEKDPRCKDCQARPFCAFGLGNAEASGPGEP